MWLHHNGNTAAKRRVMLQGEPSWLLLPRCYQGDGVCLPQALPSCVSRGFGQRSAMGSAYPPSISSSKVKDGLPGFVSHD